MVELTRTTLGRWRDDIGQGLTEYIVILAPLSAFVAFAVSALLLAGQK